MHAEWQCHAKDSRGVGNIGMELLGSISVHECSCQPTEKGPSAVSCVPHVCLSWVPHYRNRLRWGTRDYRCGIVRDTEFCFLGARSKSARLHFPCIQILADTSLLVVFAGCFKILLGARQRYRVLFSRCTIRMCAPSFSLHTDLRWHFHFRSFRWLLQDLTIIFLRKSCKAWNVTVKKFINDV